MTIQPTVSGEKAAINALAAHLRAGLGPTVQVWDHWPDAAVRLTAPSAAPGLPRSTVTILLAGERQDEVLTPYKSGEHVIHTTITPRVAPAAIADVTTANAALNAVATSYGVHAADVAAHATADTTNVVTSATATDLATGITRANDLRVVLSAHFTAAAHTTPDGAAWLARLAPVASGDSAGLIVAAKTILAALNAHYAARVDQWTVATCRQPVQLDLWTAYETERDQLRAALEPLLNTSTVPSPDGLPGDPFRNGCLVALADGWLGYADFQFSKPVTLDTADSVRRNEYRLTWSGYVDMTLDMLAQSPRLAALALAARLGRSSPVAPATVPITATLQPGGVTTITGG